MKSPKLLPMTEPEFKRKLDLNYVIRELEKTGPDEWVTGVFKSKDGCNCILGHIFDIYGGDEGRGSEAWDAFESAVATQWMLFPVNDGTSEKYTQETAKERVIAYLKDIRDGKEPTTHELMEQELAEYERREREEQC